MLSFLLTVAACSVRSGNLESEADPAESASTSTTNETRSSAAPDADGSRGDDVCGAQPGPSRRDVVCHRWRCEGRDGTTAARWSGEASTCNAGALDDDAGARALRVLNLHRFLAGVAPVSAEAAWTGAAQQCALVAHANERLSHTPGPDWRCWSDLAAVTSAVSLIANRSAPPAIAAFVEDPGNETTMVHRRWLLSRMLTRVGFGSTDRYACVIVDGRALDVLAQPSASTMTTVAPEPEPEPERDWVAWPPPGPVPMDVFASERLDEIGWTVQSSSNDLDHASVKVSSEGTQLPIRTTRLAPLLGSRSAIRFVPDGWTTRAGRSYDVRVTTGSRSFDFSVEPTDCDGAR